MHAARSCAWADDPVARSLLHAIKYDGWHRVADELSARMSQLEFPSTLSAARAMVPVPLAPGRLRERGYNQSEGLARGVAARWGLGVPVPLLQRLRETPSQTRLTVEERLTNVANAFQVDASLLQRLGDVTVFLVDDVITTGATLNACADALASAGVRTICFITYGRARDPRDAPASRGTRSHGDSGRH
ncbi:MAG: ComF family protein [Gemmatimonadaceae bacterium]|nr:ComF family protein [Gemmatimonadaceae bacterium]